jgi:tRNA threonylcarbamoyladenosine biosynthesis protein TsaE
LRRFVTRSEAQTETVGQNLAAGLSPGDLVAFYGGLGAGKTAFIRGLARGLGVVDHVSSPTFALVHEYRGRLPLFHFDMYRVSSWDELDSTGFFDYLDAGGVCAVEWSENIEAALPEGAVRVEIARTSDGDDNGRVITINGKEGSCCDEDTRD